MKPVVLSGYYGFGNVGDEAILEVVAAALRAGAPGVPLRILSADPPATARRLVRAGVFPLEEARRSVVGRDLATALKEAGRAGLLVSGGGGLLQEATSRRSLLYYLALLLRARAAGAPRVVFAQGVGPLWRWSSRRLTRLALAGASVWVRDEASRALLEGLGLDGVRLAADPLFAVRPGERAPGAPPGEDRSPLGVVLRPGAGGGLGDGELLEAAAAVARARGVPVRLIPFQARREQAWARELAARVPGVELVEPAAWEEGTSPRWLEAFQELAAVISARYHGLAFAALAGRPALALAVDPKLAHLASELEAACLHPPFRAPDVAAAVTRLLDEGRPARPETLERLRRRAEAGLEALARSAAELAPARVEGAGVGTAWQERRFWVLGVPVDPVTLEEAAAVCTRWCEEDAAGPGRQVITCNPELVMHAQDRGEVGEALRGALARADLAVADGVGLVWGARFLGENLPGRVAGADLAERLCQEAARRGWRLFLWGGEPGVAREAAVRLQARWPGLRVVGAEHGYLRGAAEQEALDRLRAARPHLLLVGLGAPRQELWIDRLRREPPGAGGGGREGGPVTRHALGAPARVMMGVGGVLDVWAGRKPRAPRWLQWLGLEWLYRVAREPTRLRRLGALPRFVAAVLAERLGREGERS